MARALSTKDLQAALETITSAIHSNRTAPFFRHLLEASQSLPNEEHMEIAVYRDAPTEPHTFFTIRLQDDKLLLAGVTEKQSSPDWVVSEDYVMDLAQKPHKFIDHPEKLSLNWLVDRLNSATK